MQNRIAVDIDNTLLDTTASIRQLLATLVDCPPQALLITESYTRPLLSSNITLLEGEDPVAVLTAAGLTVTGSGSVAGRPYWTVTN